MNAMSIRYPYSQPEIADADISAVVDSLRGTQLTQGPNLAAFEVKLASVLGASHAVVCNSGTAALHLAYLALSLGPNHGLITSPITFLSTASAARMCGAPVAFADVDPATGNLTPEALAVALETVKIPVAAVTAVHLAGRSCDMPALKKLTAAHGLALIEDASHAPLAAYSDQTGSRYRVGACAHSDIAVFSFHAIKHIAMGEGGALLTNDDRLAQRARLLRSHGMTRDPADWQSAPEPQAPWYYEMHEIGWNYRACEMQCALGLSQLQRLEDGIARRRVTAKRYEALLADIDNVKTPPPDDGHVWHLYPLAINFGAIGKNRGEFMRALATRGIGSQVHYIPLYRQPYYRNGGHEALPYAEAYFRSTLSIPMYLGLSEADQCEIVAALADVVG